MRRRRSAWATLGLLGLIVLTAGGSMGAMLRHEPRFYREAEVPAGVQRTKQSSELLQKVMNLFDAAHTPAQWSETITDEQLNSYFAEDPHCVSMMSDRRMPEQFHDPRVVIEPDRMLLAVRYGTGTLSTVISVEVDVWLPANEANVVAIRLRGLKAGMLPWSKQALLEHLTEAARQFNMDVTWHRDQGDPVALLRPRDDGTRPTILLQRLELRQGHILIEGTTEAPPNARALAPQPAVMGGAGDE
jgi:hypothetical protein